MEIITETKAHVFQFLTVSYVSENIIWEILMLKA